MVCSLMMALGVICPWPSKVQAESLTEQASLPDLAVASVVLINAERGEFHVVVENRGKGSAAKCQLRLAVIDKSGKQVLKIVYMEQPALRPNQRVRLDIGAQISLSGQRYIIVTDALNTILESSEHNNLYKGDVSRY